MNKKNLEQAKKLLRVIVSMALVICMTVVFVLFWKENYNEGIALPFYYKGYWLVGAFYAFFLIMFIYIYGGTDYGYLKASNVIFSQTLAMICANVVIYLQTVLLSARFVNAFPMLEISAIQFIVIIVWSSVWIRAFQKMFPPHKVTVLYQEYDPSIFLSKVKTRKDRYLVQKVIKVNMPWNELQEIIDKSEAIFSYDLPSEMRNEVIKYCFEKDIRVYTTPKVSDIILRSSDNIHLFDTPLLLMRNNGLNIEDRILKRFMDIVVSLLVIILTFPIMLVIAIAIKAYDGGPVFFKQKRCTLDGKVFEIHKFRSMIVDAEKEGISIPASEKDPRITPVGSIIRATRFDELPQAFDILNGNMSLVGPRPERVEHVEKYTQEVPEFVYRLKVKGGLTGYAQVYGKYNTSAYDKLKLDLMYIQNYSILLDIKLILMTIKIIFMKESTEGFDKQQIENIQK